MAWLRSELTGPDDDGYFRCPDDRDGRAVKTLDYQRALNASEPQLVEGVRDRPGQSPTFTELVGWAWVRGGTAERIGGNLSCKRVSRSTYVVEGASYTAAQVFSWDAVETTAHSSIPRHYVAQPVTSTELLVRGYSRLGTFDDFHALADGNGDFAVLLYSDTGGQGVMTDLGWAWVNGTTGALIDSGGTVAVTPARTGTGTYTATLASGTYSVAQVQQLSQTDPSTVTPCFVWAGKSGEAVASVRSLNNGGAATDADFYIRFLK